MPGLLKHLKMGTVKKGRLSKYLIYAIGEIILVVIGILIALSIKTCTEEKNEKQQLAGILNTVKNDLIQDTIAINEAIQYYKAREDVALRVIKNEFTAEEYKSCVFCTNLLTFYYPMEINDRGYKQLESFYQGSRQKDSVATMISEFYKRNIPIIDKIETQIETSALESSKYWRDNYTWFSTIVAGKFDSDFFEYMETSDYKNRVAYFYTMACKTYPYLLKQYKEVAKKLIEKIN